MAKCKHHLLPPSFFQPAQLIWQFIWCNCILLGSFMTMQFSLFIHHQYNFQLLYTINHHWYWKLSQNWKFEIFWWSFQFAPRFVYTRVWIIMVAAMGTINSIKFIHVRMVMGWIFIWQKRRLDFGHSSGKVARAFLFCTVNQPDINLKRSVSSLLSSLGRFFLARL